MASRYFLVAQPPLLTKRGKPDFKLSLFLHKSNPSQHPNLDASCVPVMGRRENQLTNSTSRQPNRDQSTKTTLMRPLCTAVEILIATNLMVQSARLAAGSLTVRAHPFLEPLSL